MTIEIHLENFDGPLDLLLHLIKTNEMDVYDIQIVEITEQYLSVIDQMQQLDLDIAGEFLLMAATLAHIKSRMLLPMNEEEDDEDEEDPRAELVRRLLEYQRYKEAAESLEALPRLEREVFVSHFVPLEVLDEDSGDEVSVSVYRLAGAFQLLLRDIPPEVFHEVVREPLSVSEHIQLLVKRLAGAGRTLFRELFAARPVKEEVVVTFLAMLELVKMRLIKIEQAAGGSEIWLALAGSEADLEGLELGEGTLGYG